MPYENATVGKNALQLKVPMLIIPSIEDRVKIGKYTTKNGPAKASRHFSVPETATRRLKTEYFWENPPNFKTTNNFVPAKFSCCAVIHT